MNDLIFKVEKVPVKNLLKETPSLKSASGISHAIVAKKEIVHYVSATYALMDNKVIKASFDEALKKAGLEFKFSYQAFRNTRFRMSYRLLKLQTEVEVGDAVGIELYINNSYDGSIKYSFGVGLIRLVCENGLTIMDNDKTVNRLHTPGADDGIAVEESLRLLSEVEEEWEKFIEPFQDLTLSNVESIEARIEEVIEDTTYPVGLTDLAIERANYEHNTLGIPKTDWLIYQALSYPLIHSASNLLGRKRDRIDREVLRFLLEY